MRAVPSESDQCQPGPWQTKWMHPSMPPLHGSPRRMRGITFLSMVGCISDIASQRGTPDAGRALTAVMYESAQRADKCMQQRYAVYQYSCHVWCAPVMHVNVMTEKVLRQRSPKVWMGPPKIKRGPLKSGRGPLKSGGGLLKSGGVP